MLGLVALGFASPAGAEESSETLVRVPSPVLDGREQLTLERLNAVRAAPQAHLEELRALAEASVRAKPDRCASEPDLFDTLLTAPAQPPLAPLEVLGVVADAHALDMIDRAFFGHVNPDGVGPNDRVRAAGVALSATAPAEGNRWYRYSTAAGANQLEALYRSRQTTRGREQPQPDRLYAEAVDSLVVDRCVPDRGHRRHLLGLSPLNARDRLAGVGTATRGGPVADKPGFFESQMTLVVLTWVPEPDEVHLTGVLYEDRDRDGRYSVGEGLGGERVEVPTEGVYTVTAPGGGYTLALPVGSSGEAVALGQVRSYELGPQNVKLDFVR